MLAVVLPVSSGLSGDSKEALFVDPRLLAWAGVCGVRLNLCTMWRAGQDRTEQHSRVPTSSCVPDGAAQTFVGGVQECMALCGGCPSGYRRTAPPTLGQGFEYSRRTAPPYTQGPYYWTIAWNQALV